jgi:amino acid transporter
VSGEHGAGADEGQVSGEHGAGSGQEGSGGARPLGGWSLLALGVNGVVGVGIFFVPADLATQAPGVASVAVIGGTALLLAPVALTFAALGGRFPEDGGPVVYARAAFPPQVAFAVGWLAFVSAVASTSAVLSGLVHALGPSLGLVAAAADPAALGRPAGLDPALVEGIERAGAVGLGAALGLVCAAGVALSARVWTALTVLKLVPLVALGVAAVLHGFAVAAPDGASRAAVAVAAGVTARGLAAAALVATFSFQGFEIVPVVAGQARANGRLIERAVLGSLALPALLYVLLQWACVRALPQLAGSPAPLVEAARAYGGPGLAALVSAGTNISALGIAFGMMAMTPRYLSSLAREGTLGFGLDQESPRGVPLRALAVTILFVAALVLAGGRGELFALSSVAVLAQYAVSALALLVLSWKGQNGLTRKDGWPAIPALLVGLGLASGATRREWAVAGAALLIGVVLRLASRGRAGAQAAGQ